MPVAAPDPVRAVENQTPPLEDVNPYDLDAALREGVAREGGGWADAHLDRLDPMLEAAGRTPEAAQVGARRLVEGLALALQGALLVRHAPGAVTDAFCAGRLGDGGLAFGTLPTGTDLRAVVARAWPAA